MASERRVRLVPQGQVVPDNGYRLVIDATDANLIDPAFFVMRRYTMDAQAGATSDLFDHVAAPDELATLPIDAPDETSAKLFRTAHFDQTYAMQSLAESVWAALQMAVGLLKIELDAADSLAELGAVWIGTPPE